MPKRDPENLLRITHCRRTGLWLLSLWLVSLSLSGCQKGVVEPVAIEPEDMCSFCRMAISEKRYAAEFIDKEGQSFKFDDIICMTSFLREMPKQDNISAYFVMDFGKKSWLNAGNAYYVQSNEIKTPMRGGIIAFKDEPRAREAAGQYGGKLLSFNEVFNGGNQARKADSVRKARLQTAERKERFEFAVEPSSFRS